MFPELLFSAKHCVRLLTEYKEEEKDLAIDREQLAISFNGISSLSYFSHSVIHSSHVS